MTTYNEENPVTYLANLAASDVESVHVSEKLQKEFNVLKLIDGYRSRGHLFTKTNPVRERRSSSPTLDIENFGLSKADLNTVFDAARVIKIKPCSLQEIIKHLDTIYCQHIGVEYMYIRNPEVVEWIQNKIGINDNQPNFTTNEKLAILNKLNQAVSFENFFAYKICWTKAILSRRRGVYNSRS